MITTFEEIIKNNSFETFKKYEVDKWIGGINTQCHVSALMVMDKESVCVWYKEIYERKYHEVNTKYEEPTISTMSFKDAKTAIWASSENEMNIDYKLLKEKQKAEDNYIVNNCLAKMKEFCMMYNDICYDLKREVDRAIKVNNDGCYDVVHSNADCWFDDDDSLDEDDMWEINSIHQRHCVKFINKDNKDISTVINLDSVQAIYKCVCNDKECIHIKTCSGENYYIFKKENYLEYKALCVLYGFSI